jgi:dihydrofolate reductase
MGRTTFEPALSAPFWPWGDLPVYVLGSRLPAGAHEHVIVDDGPERLLERLRGENHGADVHLVGGPKTFETYRALGALDEFRLMVLPVFVGTGRQHTPELSTDIAVTLSETRTWPSSVVELVYKLSPGDPG